jgi:hypothetical protein
MAQRASLAQRGLQQLRQLALRNFPLAPVDGPASMRLAAAVDEEELAVQRAWLAFVKTGGKRRATFCERFGMAEPQ